MNVLCRQLLLSVLIGSVLPGILSAALLQISLPDTEPMPEHSHQQIPPNSKPETMWIPVLHNGEINNIELETYIVSVVLGEVSPLFELEALKAQAVAARTYTLSTVLGGNRHPEGAVCTDYRCCQAYREPEDYLSEGGSDEGLARIRDAVMDTAGQVLYYNDELICATYYASSGGMTEDAREVWGTSYAYLVPVNSPGEEDCGYYGEKKEFSTEEFQSLLGVKLNGTPDEWFGVVVPTAGGGVDLMRIGGRLYTGVELRKRLGLRSTVFSVTVSGDVIVFDTKGYGHRVGMSQHGANAMAKTGADYCEIVGHYYPGTSLTTYLPNGD